MKAPDSLDLVALAAPFLPASHHAAPTPNIR